MENRKAMVQYTNAPTPSPPSHGIATRRSTKSNGVRVAHIDSDLGPCCCDCSFRGFSRKIRGYTETLLDSVRVLRVFNDMGCSFKGSRQFARTLLFLIWAGTIVLGGMWVRVTRH